MRWVLSASAVLILAGCRGSYEPPAPILTLIPAAMRVAGPSTKVDDHTLCLMAGGSVEAPVYVHRSTATVVLVASSPRQEAVPGFAVQLGARMSTPTSIRGPQGEARAYHLDAARGEQVLRVVVSENSPGALCLQQVVMTQP